MGFLDSLAVPYFGILIAFVVLLGFFRKLFVKVIVVLIVEVVLFVLYPKLLVHLATLVETIRHSLT